MPLFHVTPRMLDDDQVVRVRDPATGQLVPAQGVPVEWSVYWERRLQDEEVTKSDLPPEPTEEGDLLAPQKDARSRRSTSSAASADNKD